MQQKGPRYKTGAFTFWFRLCLKLHFRCRVVLQLGHHDHLDTRLHVAVDLDGHLVGPEGLYRLLQSDAAPVQADTTGPLDGVGDVGGGDGAEEPLVLAGAGLDGYDALVEGAGDLLRPLGEAAVPLLGLLHHAAGFLQFARGSHLGEPAGEEKVAHVAAANVHDVAALPDLLDVLVEYHLHELPPTVRPRKAAAPSLGRALSPRRPPAGAADRARSPCGP